MMNKNSIVIIGAVVLVLIGVFFYFSSADASWTEDWLPDGQTNQGITGQWFIEPYLVLEDGTRTPLKESANALWMEGPDGYQVITVDYVLSAQATRDEHQGTFDSVEIDLSNFRLNTRYYPIGLPTEWMDVWKDYSGTVILPFDGGSTQTAVTEVASFSIPVEITDSNGFLGLPLSTLPCSTMNEMTADWETGAYSVEYSGEGTLQFRGKNANYGDGDWVNAALPGTVSHGVSIGGNEVSMDWTSDISYN